MLAYWRGGVPACHGPMAHWPAWPLCVVQHQHVPLQACMTPSGKPVMYDSGSMHTMGSGAIHTMYMLRALRALRVLHLAACASPARTPPRRPAAAAACAG